MVGQGMGKVRSFDLFDTLLGRFGYRPDSIFELVEERSGFPGFVFLRKGAQSLSDGTLVDVYRKFQELTGISKKAAAALLQCEFETELEHIFPIVPNVREVRRGDWIVTDTYYDEAQIRKILRKIGVAAGARVLATPSGKHSGLIWDRIRRERKVSFHLGDSLHSDVAQPRSRGIEAVHYTGSQWSVKEKEVLAIGHPQIACLMRALRLQNPYPVSSPEAFLWEEQSQLNIPFLIEASLYLDAFCRKKGKKRILFTARDCCLWIRLFRVLYPNYESIYFHTSRYLYQTAPPSFVEYVRDLYTPETIIVDLHGKGRTCAKFFHKNLGIRPVYLAAVNCGKQNQGMLRTPIPLPCVEKLNYDLVGSLYGMKKRKPVRCKPEYDLKFIRPSHACMDKCLEIVSRFSLPPYDPKVLQWAVGSMRSGLAIERFVDHAAHHFHLQTEDGPVRHVHQLESGCLFEQEAGLDPLAPLLKNSGFGSVSV